MREVLVFNLVFPIHIEKRFGKNIVGLTES